jgi:DegV family protein with EDD domain
VARIKVVTDSGADIPRDLLAKYHIDMVALDVRLGTDESGNLTGLIPEEFWRRVRASNLMVETSAPSPGAYISAFLRARDEGFDAVCCITLSSDLSGVYQTACLAANEVSEQIAVRVVDSRWGSVSQALLVLDAAQRCANKQDLDELCGYVKAQIPTLEAVGALDSLECLRRGGRIGPAQAFFGALFSIKPVITMKGGLMAGASRQRTRASSLRYLTEVVAAASPIRSLVIAHADAEDIDDFLEMASPLFPAGEDKTVTTYMGPVMGAHLGPGAITLCLQRA